MDITVNFTKEGFLKNKTGFSLLLYDYTNMNIY